MHTPAKNQRTEAGERRTVNRTRSSEKGIKTIIFYHLFSVLCLLFFADNLAFATIFHVSSSEELLQDQGLANDGDTIVLAPGTYTGLWVWELTDAGWWAWVWHTAIDPHGKDLIYTSENPNDPNIIASTILSGVRPISPDGHVAPEEIVPACLIDQYPIGGGGGDPVIYSSPDCQLRGLTIRCGGSCFRPAEPLVYLITHDTGYPLSILKISNCRFIKGDGENNASAVGSLGYTDLTIENCTFSSIDNLHWQAGPLIYSNGDPLNNGNITIEDCNISDNNLSPTSSRMVIYSSDINLTIRNSSITGNNGTSIDTIGNNNITIDNCIIDGTGANQGGLVLGEVGAADNITITNSTIKNNSYNGGISACAGSVLIQDCKISGNDENDGNPGGGISISGANAIIDNCAIIDNEVSWGGGGGIFIFADNATITKCTISGNRTTSGGVGGGIWNAGNGTTISHCIIKENQANNEGGGICSNYPLNIINCMITENQAGGQGGGIYLISGDSAANIINCTIADNSAIEYGGAYLDFRVDLKNCIIWGNSPDYKQLYTYPRYDFSKNAYGYVEISNCDIENSKSFTCNSVSYLFDSNFPDDCGYLPDYLMGKNTGGNLLPPQNPQFTYAYHIGQSSPCVNAGNNDAVIAFGIEFDIDLVEDRIIGGIVDIGADEVGGGGGGGKYFPDYNSDNFVNFLDFAVFADYWLTENPFISLDEDDDVDIYDLKIFCNYWLERTID
jgi:hypothetical protein